MTAVAPLKRIARLRYGSSLPEERREDGPVPVYGSSGPVGRHTVANTLAPVIVIGRKGSSGKVHYSPEPVFVIDTAYFIDSSCTKADLRWLKYVLETIDLDRPSQDVGVPGLSREVAYVSSIPVTSPERQDDIANYLDLETTAMDNLFDRKWRMLSLLDEKRAAVGLAAVSGRLTAKCAATQDSNLPWIPFLPSHWRVVKLSLVAKLGTGHTPSRSESAYWETERDIPWLTTSDIEQFRDDRRDVLHATKESISKIGLENSSAELHPAGTVALSRTASVGFSVVMGTDMATSQDYATWTCSERLDPQFLLLCLRAMRTDLQKRLATGSTHKTVYMPVIQGLRIPLPPVDEQRRAVKIAAEKMGEIDRLAGLINRQLPLLSERRDGLIRAVVSGERDFSSRLPRAVAA